jgi:hypothetical protein
VRFTSPRLSKTAQFPAFNGKVNVLWIWANSGRLHWRNAGPALTSLSGPTQRQPKINSSQFPNRKMARKAALVSVATFEFLRSCITAPAQRHTRAELRPFSKGSSRTLVFQVSDFCHSTSRILPQQPKKGITGRESSSASPYTRPSHNRITLRDLLSARPPYSTSGRWFVVLPFTPRIISPVRTYP